MTFRKITISGDYAAVGRTLGRRNRTEIQRIIGTHPELNRKMLPLYATDGGRRRYDEFLAIHQKVYPEYIAELEGMAAGAGCRFRDLFLLNLRGEFMPFDVNDASGGCSTCTVSIPDFRIIGHNEDAAAIYRNILFFAEVTPDAAPGFTTLSYPGSLCGNAVGWNARGIFFTVNITAPRHVRVGPGRYFAARSLLAARSMEDAVARITQSRRASGFNYTVASFDDQRIVNVEVTAETHHVRAIDGAYFHTNHYIEIPGTDHLITSSSRRRLIRGQEHLSRGIPRDEAAVRAILGDTTAIYRRAASPEDTATLMTIVCDLPARTVTIYSGHPVTAIEQREVVHL